MVEKFSFKFIRDLSTGLLTVTILVYGSFSLMQLHNMKQSIVEVIDLNERFFNLLSDVNVDFYEAKSAYFDFKIGKNKDLSTVVSLMKETIGKCKKLKELSKEFDFVDESELDILLHNAKLIRMAANAFNKSFRQSRLGSSTQEMESAIKKATENSIPQSFMLLSDIRNRTVDSNKKLVSIVDNTSNFLKLIFIMQILISVCVALLLRAVLKSRIGYLLYMARAIAEGDFSKRVPVVGKDFFAVLSSAINQTAEDLSFLHQSLLESKGKADAANKAKSNFLSNMSHEIRTPLNCISGFAELIADSSEEKRVQDNAKVILVESQHLLELVNTILDHAKIEAGKLKLEHRPFNLKSLLSNTETMMLNLLRDKQVKFRLNVANNVPACVNSDSLRINQILRNLLSNAAKFTDKGIVELEVNVNSIDATKADIRFIVRDSGVGIPKDKIEHIFNSFTQVDESITRQYGGTGLGTTITKELLELFDSQLKVQSIEGLGSEFRFDLKLDLADAETVSETENLSLSKTKQVNGNEGLIEELNTDLKILLADDYLPNQKLFEAYLKSAGLNALIVDDGQKACDAADRAKYDLIFLDVQMPVKNGYDAAKHIREKSLSKSAFIVGISADASAESRKKCLDSGMDELLHKPIAKADMLEQIAKVQTK